MQITLSNCAAIAARGLIYYSASKNIKETLVYNIADMATCVYLSRYLPIKTSSGSVNKGIKSSAELNAILSSRTLSSAIGCIITHLALGRFANGQIAMVANAAACIVGVGIDRYRKITSELLL